MSETLLINNILNTFLESKASDLYLLAGNNPVIRAEGKIITLTDQDILNPDTIQSIAESFLSREQLAELSQKKELSISYVWANRARFRVKFFYQKGYLAISLRLIPAFILSPKELKIPTAILQLLNKDKGLIIISGPFGSGRSTTAASLIETLNQNKGRHIQTLERPIEYLFVNNQSIIEQREVGRDVESFSQGLKDMFNEDIDVAFLDQFYESGLADLALELVESGKLLILVIVANSAISAIERFLSLLSLEKRTWGREVLPEVLLGVLSQRLLPKIGGGQIVASEVLTSTNAVKASIRDGNFQQLRSIMQTSRDEGMQVLDKSLLELVKSGQVNMEEAKKESTDFSSLR
ncbi:MAG: ATPase, T2SS/T4P/T4SS family [Patescibacteria group bacterium]|nr:ATPase, T2SS/T4P/T4SS family [Patescibacteria group bacterium]